jgi:hypothetical protein
MSHSLTNERLNGLLLSLGFEAKAASTSHHRWEHPQSGCVFHLPANKLQEAPRPADLLGVKAQLDLQGHLAASEFDEFAREGRMPSPVALE